MIISCRKVCRVTLINIAYCSLAVFGFGVQRLVFGQLRVAEAQRVKDKFWNYVFYKFIFVFGVINVQYMDEVLLWCSWFTLVGFLHLLGQLCKDRYEYIINKVNTISAPLDECILTEMCVNLVRRSIDPITKPTRNWMKFS
uniref:E3 ubiquitin-protein ligase synoviolin-like TPR repeats domain-containing protein n=1 Tax=Heliothis virescens TaxID=7102 RepID=A0A2A4JGF0_HELVI